MAKNNNDLHVAKKNKSDEFFTRFEDINTEINTNEHGYRPFFKDQTVYCNCDDPEESNFWKFFKAVFKAYGIKKLISTHYAQDGSSSYKLEYDGERVVKTELEGNGDFRSPECVELLKESDIVVTNPPFSLFRDFISLIIKHNKKFIVLGKMNMMTYKEVFPLLKDNKMWPGYGFNLSMIFGSPYKNELESNRKYVIAKGLNPDDGYVKVPEIAWFTNLEIPKRTQPLLLGWKYEKGLEMGLYPKYDNYDAINIDEVCQIPRDYAGVMGVPITFMGKYCPEQFEIVALGNSKENFVPTKQYVGAIKHRKDGSITNGNAVNSVLVIKLDTPLKSEVYYTTDTEILFAPYARILVKKKIRQN